MATIEAELDGPDGITLTDIKSDPDGPLLQVYTGRWTPQLSPDEVEELVEVLQRWLTDKR